MGSRPLLRAFVGTIFMLSLHIYWSWLYVGKWQTRKTRSVEREEQSELHISINKRYILCLTST